MIKTRAPICVLLASWPATPALADWDVSMPAKWIQEPDLDVTGIDVNCSNLPQDYILADDFECTETGLITGVHIWGSWYQDLPPWGEVPEAVTFTLSLHADIPAGENPDGYSMPGETVCWQYNFAILEDPVTAADDPEGPERFGLRQNVPKPVNPLMEIRYAAPPRASTARSRWSCSSPIPLRRDTGPGASPGPVFRHPPAASAAGDRSWKEVARGSRDLAVSLPETGSSRRTTSRGPAKNKILGWRIVLPRGPMG